MKQNLAIFLAVAMMLGCASCMRRSENDNPVAYYSPQPADTIEGLDFD